MTKPFLLIAGLCLWASSAQAQARVVVLPFDGPGAARVRAAVVEALDEAGGYELVKEKDATHAAHAVGADLTTEEGRVAVASQLSAAAFIEGEIDKHGSSSRLSLRVYGGSNGALLGETKVRASHDALARHAKKVLLEDLGSALTRARPPTAKPEDAREPEAEPEPTPKPAREVDTERAPRVRPDWKAAPVETEPASESEPESERSQALELGASVRLLTRSSSYRDALLKLGEHSLDPTPALRLEARWYPAAHFTRSYAANLGLDLHGQMMWPVDATRDNLAFRTNSVAFGIAARLRIPVAEHELGVFAGYGGQSLSIADAKGQDPGVPSVAYGFVRLGVDGRFELVPHFSVGVRAAYLVLTGFGELAQAAWFSHVGGGGIEAELSLAYELSPLVTVSAGGGLTRYFMSLNPAPNDPGARDHGRVAGGLADQYPYGLVGVTLRP